jgi:hypothetical protein
MIALACAIDQAQPDMELTAWRRPSQSKLLNMAYQLLTDTTAMDDGFRVLIVVASAIQHIATRPLTWAMVPSYQCMAP